MPKELTSQILKMTCTACGTEKSWEMVGAEQNQKILQEMQEWYQVGRKVVDERGQLTQILGDACSLACVPAVAVKITRPPTQDEEPLDNIDLASLRTGFVQ